MTCHAAIWGRLGRDPHEIRTSTGTRMATASVAVELEARNAAGETTTTEWCDVVAFNRLADELLRHRQGDTLSASGRLQVRLWTDRDGNERRTWQIVADSLVSARTVRPGGGRRQSEQSERPARTRRDPAVTAVRAQAPLRSELSERIEAELSDEIPF